MSDGPDSPPPDGASPTRRDLGVADLTNALPPRTRADSSVAAEPIAPPYTLSGASMAARGETAAAQPSAQPALRTSRVTLTPKASFAPAAARGDLPRDAVTVQPDDLIEVEFDHGERLWVRGDDFRVNFTPASVGRDPVSGVDQIDVPVSLPVASRGLASRGPVAWVIKGLKVFGVDLAGESARALGELVDFPSRPSRERQKPGVVYHCVGGAGAFDLQPLAEPLETHTPWLLFIHGTLSSTWGSFGELWSEKRATELAALRQKYAHRIIAFEHATLTEDPFQNARDLVKQLPPQVTLHVVSHSRGGLVGELLCRAGVVSTGGAAASGDSSRPFDDEQLSIFRADVEDDAKTLAVIRELEQLLQQKQIVVERFVRVACPALGTTLASGRLDRWISVIGTIAGAALPDTPLFDAFKDIGDFVAAIVKQRTDPKTLPGLEAQMPDSRCIKLVNWPGVRVSGDLAVIAGDIEPDAWWARLLVWLSDRFYDGDHDLVVNTPSMLGGALRTGVEAVSPHKGPAVNHFSYFAEQPSAERLVAALRAKAGTPADGFEPLHKPTTSIARTIASRSGSDASLPIVIVLPGIMGTALKDGSGSIWLDARQILRGGLARLSIDRSGILAGDPFDRYYGELIEHLSVTHTVVPFGFDWRLDLDAEASRLGDVVRQQLAIASARQQPVRLLAHSMGGLVVRLLIARQPELWTQICAHEGARFVMLGTPNGGSHAITELLVGRSSVLRKLARLDIRHSPDQLLGFISRFPGILSMLPAADTQYDYFSADAWRTWGSLSGLTAWPIATDLDRAREIRRLLDASPIDPARMAYVAGSADVTIAGVKVAYDLLSRRDRIEFVATTRGDGRVTWDSGIPPTLRERTWYVDVEHGDLAAHRPSFTGLTELLSSGTTTLLEQRPPVARAAQDLFPLPLAEDDRYPDTEDLVATVVGSGPRARRTRATRERPLDVSVVHGNFAFSRHTIAVGHYAGDAIVSAERQLDLALERALSRRHHLGIYPGPLETNARFINPNCRDPRFLGIKGALVIGLGGVGRLTASQLTRTFTRGLLDYALEQGRDGRFGGNNACALDLAAVLIGTNAGGISVADSVFALVRGVLRANESLKVAKQPERIRSLELIELWEDRALDAVRALQGLLRQPELRERISVEPTLQTRDGGLRRLSHEEPANWWQRLQILGRPGPGDADGALRFSAVTRRARAEVQLLSTQRRLVDQYIERAMATTSDDRSVARTLFELLLPNDLKENAPDQDDVVLLVDEESARYPWELLEDGLTSGRKPWVIEHGVLRQLESQSFRETVQSVTDRTALIIGDPVSPFVELKGAQAEAEAVRRALSQDFNAVAVIRGSEVSVMTALFQQPWKVLHLAGHGVYRYVPPDQASGPNPPQPVTGMVLGKETFLRPAEIRQMRRVPDLVFINCCHLGHIERLSDQAHTAYDLAFPQLAANLATEFIDMGVRAVIAAGWAVNDLAATTFATTFYDQMLRGEPFGKAVHTARKETYDRHPGSNTWGAYQCYGDPAYSLRIDVPLDASSELRIVSSADAAQDLSNIAARLKTGATSDRNWEIERIEKIRAAIEQKGWMSHGGVLAALARAFGEAGRFDDAIELYAKALHAEDGQVSLRDVEQLANFEVRNAVKRWRTGAIDREAATAQITKSIGMLETLSGLTEQTVPFGISAERLSLIASAYKRMAQIAEGDARIEALRQMERFYRRATTLAEETKGDVAYPLINAIAASLILGWHARKNADAERAARIDDLARQIAASVKGAPE